MIDLSWIPGPGVVPWCCLVDPKQHGAAETWVSRHRTEKGVACRHTEAGWLWKAVAFGREGGGGFADGGCGMRQEDREIVP